jgi:ABC-type sugar transport system ATPase subunit
MFVARFLGSPGMNFIPGELSEEKGKLGVRIHSGQFIPLKEEQKEKLASAPKEVIVGVRPEDIQVGETGDIEAEVYVLEPMGAQNVLTLRLDDTLVKALLPGDFFKEVGSKVFLSFKDVRVFDAKTEKMIA